MSIRPLPPEIFFRLKTAFQSAFHYYVVVECVL